MSLDKAELCDSLLNWTFEVPSCSSKSDLTTGVAIAHVLHRIDPSWFNETWLGRIKEDSDANWRLKVNNLKKILQSMLEYYHDVLGHSVSERHLPDVNLIGEHGDETELGRLVQLVLGCAVSCEKKQEQIQQIMTLEESVQHVVMTAIQELLAKDPPSEPGSPETYGDFDHQSRKYYFLSEEADEKDDLGQRCRILELQGTPAITNKKLLLLQSQMEQLQEENYRLENSRDDMRVRADLLQREVLQLQFRNEELTSLAEEAQNLKDEMDILRHSSDRVGRLEALVDSYKRKLEDLGDLRRQVRLLEERNTVYMQRTCELEEELRRANAARTQLDSYKRQRLLSERDTLRETNEELRCVQVQQKLENSRDDMRVRADLLQREVLQLQFRNEELTSLAEEAQNLKDEMDILRHSSDRVGRLEALVDSYKRKLEDLGDLRRQVRLLEERNTVYMQRTCELEEELRRANAARTQLDSYKRQVHELDSRHSAEAMKAEKWQFEYRNLHDKYEALVKEKERLLSERDTLRETNEELRCVQVQQKCLGETGGLCRDSVGSLAAEIMPTEFKETVVRLQTENRMLCVQEGSYSQQLQEMEGRLEEVQRANNSLETHNREKLHEAHSDLQKKREVIDDLEPRVGGGDQMSRRIDELQESLKRKDEDMRMMEERYKRYVEKARTVIKTLDPAQQQPVVSPGVQALKNQLTEKERRLHHLEGLALHQQVSNERLGPSGPAMSFLAQQRQSTNARRGRTRPQPR
ncbi:hypothetical protein CRUP_011652 [Coryphaenoides rupestris]|nr:hypothetical protein CRUP_011652 [Coryphaenoides rupestris]